MQMRQKTSDLQPSQGLLTRLAKNEAGNVLIMTVFGLIPMAVAGGGAIDIGRVYLAKDHLQAACDAAVLATRKSMVGRKLNSNAMSVGQSFFNLNFPRGAFGTTNSRLWMSVQSDGAVYGSATTRNAGAVFRDMGITPEAISVTCAANLEMSNTDVVFALDTTGSMNQTNPGDSVTRLQAARTAVTGFTKLLSENLDRNVQLRFGFVPFSSNVNVGFLLKPEWMVNNWTYQSRVANGVETTTETDTWTEETQYGPWTVTSGSMKKSRSFGQAIRDPGSEIGGGGQRCKEVPPSTYNSQTTYSAWKTSAYPGGGTLKKRTATRKSTGKRYRSYISEGRCIIELTSYNNYTETRAETIIPKSGSKTRTKTDYKWLYQPVAYDVSAVKRPSRSFVVPKLGDKHTAVTVKWDGCIEERDTVRTDKFSTVPDAAYDLDIDRIPDSKETRWRPFLPALVFWRKDGFNWDLADWSTTSNSTRADKYRGGVAAVCPDRSRKLGAMNQSQVKSYVDGLTARGTTYLDIGMIWAARLASPTGLFQKENNSSSNGKPISRHIIFMTDGQIETLNYVYEAYGLSALDRRRTSPSSLPSDSDQNELVDIRFRAACEAAKAKGITVWTIAFGTELTDSLKACASKEYYFASKNAAELNSTFAAIAAEIAQLRLVK